MQKQIEWVHQGMKKTMELAEWTNFRHLQLILEFVQLH